MLKASNGHSDDISITSTLRSIMVTRRPFSTLLICILLLGAGSGFSSICLGSIVDDSTRAVIVDTVSAKLRELYVYPDIAEKMVHLIRTRLESGEYDDIETLEDFVTELNRDMLSVFPDGHLEVSVMRKHGPEQTGTQDWWEEQAKNSRFNNFGFHRLDRLPGNVGYLELTIFDYPELAGETLVAAMQYLAHTDAIIIDLRQNPGGRGELVQILLSYFFEDHRVHFLTEQDGVRNITRQWWTLPYVPGTRKPETPLYILTSANTGSAAEEFAFALKNLGRAKIVGETTAGAAHKTHNHTYPDLNIEIHMPDGRSFDPISGKDWEGAGVAPHIPTDSDRALEIAHTEAIETLLENETKEDRRFRLEWAHRDLKARQSPILLDKKAMKRYVGTYGPRKISLNGDTLCYQRENRPRSILVPLGDNWFKLQDLDYFRIRFVADERGSISTLVGVYDDGSESQSERTGE